MNRQKTGVGIEWTQVYGRPGYTWNPLGGCLHDCQWTMPDGQIAICYAKEVAQGVANLKYPHGFEHIYWHPERLLEPARVKKPAGIFLDSMSDLFGTSVPVAYIQAILKTVAENPQHIFFSLTKNAPRLLGFNDEMPNNLWVGVSMPPSYMYGHQLSHRQQIQYVRTALNVLEKLERPGRVRWMSFEPLSYAVDITLDLWNVLGNGAVRPLPLEWAVIGAASAGKVKYQPDPKWVAGLLKTLGRQQIPVFFKGNLKGNMGIESWRQEFPPEPHQEVQDVS